MSRAVANPLLVEAEADPYAALRAVPLSFVLQRVVEADLADVGDGGEEVLAGE